MGKKEEPPALVHFSMLSASVFAAAIASGLIGIVYTLLFPPAKPFFDPVWPIVGWVSGMTTGALAIACYFVSAVVWNGIRERQGKVKGYAVAFPAFITATLLSVIGYWTWFVIMSP